MRSTVVCGERACGPMTSLGGAEHTSGKLRRYTKHEQMICKVKINCCSVQFTVGHTKLTSSLGVN